MANARGPKTKQERKSKAPVRPNRVWSETLIPGILRQAELGVPQKLIAQGLNIGESTFSQWLERYEDFREQFNEARVRGVEARLSAIRDSIAGGKEGNHDWKADAWLLSRMFPEEFANPEKKLEIITQNNVTTNVTVVTVSPEKLAEIQQRKVAALAGAHGRN